MPFLISGGAIYFNQKSIMAKLSLSLTAYIRLFLKILLMDN